MTDIRGMEVASPGTYVLLPDVIQVIREYAQSLDDPNVGAAVHELASWLGAGAHFGTIPDEPAAPSSEDDPFPLENVYRVELYPHPPDDPSPKWYARSVDQEGNILWTTAGDFQYENVHREASERWPDKPIFELKRWADDSVFVENQEKKAYPTAAPMRERVSPKRMFA